MKFILFYVLKILFLMILPFLVLIRSATFLHTHYFLSSWYCLVTATVITSLLMFIYFSVFYGKLTGRFGDFDSVKRRAFISILFVAVYSVHGILFFSGSNFKNAALNQEINNLHPVLRLSISTLIHLDHELIITDASRQPEDYQKMGLPTKSNSLHYPQKSTGYAHAVDLRTKGRSEIKNALISSYFRLMGFRTLRHVGTADHLHVSLISHDHPHAR